MDLATLLKDLEVCLAVAATMVSTVKPKCFAKAS